MLLRCWARRQILLIVLDHILLECFRFFVISHLFCGSNFNSLCLYKILSMGKSVNLSINSCSVGLVRTHGPVLISIYLYLDQARDWLWSWPSARLVTCLLICFLSSNWTFFCCCKLYVSFKYIPLFENWSELFDMNIVTIFLLHSFVQLRWILWKLN